VCFFGAGFQRDTAICCKKAQHLNPESAPEKPITPRILSTRLKELEKQGLVQKNLVLGAKPKIEYRSTQKAEGLRKAIAELEKWGAKVLSKK